MDYLVLLLLVFLYYAEASIYCEKLRLPLEVGVWNNELKHMDSAVIENGAVSINEGQIYVYENSFPDHTIRYINIDNLAKKSCGANSVIKKGGVGTSYVLIVLHAESKQEMRSVIDIWGTKNYYHDKVLMKLSNGDPTRIRNMKSLYLFKDMRTVNHNHNIAFDMDFA